MGLRSPSPSRSVARYSPPSKTQRRLRSWRTPLASTPQNGSEFAMVPTNMMSSACCSHCGRVCQPAETGRWCPLARPSGITAASRGTSRQANHELDYLLNELRRCRGRRELTKTRIASSRALLRDNPSPFAAASNSLSSVPSTTGPILWLCNALSRPASGFDWGHFVDTFL
jgi:hypothetical protein